MVIIKVIKRRPLLAEGCGAAVWGSPVGPGRWGVVLKIPPFFQNFDPKLQVNRAA